MEADTVQRASKVPEITLLFWILKILATTLGETGGDALSMSMDLGYLTATPDELHKLVAACTVDVQHVLRRPASLASGASFGLTLACPGDPPRRWLSVNFTAGRLVDIYYLPGDPIQFVGPGD